jgi:hypothetical protein
MARPVFIDALNVAYWIGDPPSLRVPIALIRHLLAAGHHAVLYFDASARYRLRDEGALYEALLKDSQHCVEVPSGKPADRVLLRDAAAKGACVVSRDKFRDHRRRRRKLIDDPARLISGTVSNNRVLVPALGLDVALAES